jgi:hypothetical protein
MKKAIVSVLACVVVAMSVGCVQEPITPKGYKLCRTDYDCPRPLRCYSFYNSYAVCHSAP